MIKVCFTVSSLAGEGPVNVMYNIIQYMDFSVFDVSIITLIPEKKSSRIDDFRRLPVSIYQLAKEKPLNPLALFRALKKCVRGIDPHMLHSHCPRSLYLMCFLPRKYKRIYTIHIYPGRQQKILYGTFKGTIVIMLNHYFTSKTDLPIGCAENVAALYKQKKGWNIMSIPNGSSLPVWQGDETEKQFLRDKFNLREDIRYFISIGRFSKEKNPDVLIKAIKKKNNPRIGLILLGNGPMWDELKKEESDRILLPGFTTEVYDYLKASDYYISASDVEGLANTLLESMTIGLPVVLSDIPSHREVMAKMKKEAGYIFDNKNMNDLTDKIGKVLSISREEAIVEIKRVFEDYYTAKRMSDSYQAAYKELYQKNKGE